MLGREGGALSKMHWTPEHAQPLNQWPEQHLDVSSTTPSPAHKLELPPGGRQLFSLRGFVTTDLSLICWPRFSFAPPSPISPSITLCASVSIPCSPACFPLVLLIQRMQCPFAGDLEVRG
ncbi:fidgetin-like protein 2 [Lynx pardinus]|uniref:Fidgetin-like protein 2 n=1 Tax=Lynx pardinus TaxID=191816 RepID=A0A485PGF3_LYNPA|nr:fidgetin-like protein 2 [Lynx pardinus]